jgi:hypothetical protein
LEKPNVRGEVSVHDNLAALSMQPIIIEMQNKPAEDKQEILVQVNATGHAKNESHEVAGASDDKALANELKEPTVAEIVIDIPYVMNLPGEDVIVIQTEESDRGIVLQVTSEQNKTRNQ